MLRRMATLATVTSLATMQFEFSQTGCGNECSRYVHSLNKPEVEHNIMITHARIADDTVESDRSREGGRRGQDRQIRLHMSAIASVPPLGLEARIRGFPGKMGGGIPGRDPWERSPFRNPWEGSLADRCGRSLGEAFLGRSLGRSLGGDPWEDPWGDPWGGSTWGDPWGLRDAQNVEYPLCFWGAEILDGWTDGCIDIWG